MTSILRFSHRYIRIAGIAAGLFLGGTVGANAQVMNLPAVCADHDSMPCFRRVEHGLEPGLAHTADANLNNVHVMVQPRRPEYYDSLSTGHPSFP